MRISLQDVTSIGLLGCAVAVVVILIRGPSGGGSNVLPGDSTPHPVKNWDAVRSTRNLIGNQDAPMLVVEFGDFECPACKGFEKAVLGPFRAKHPSEVAVAFRHWPLSYHRFARPMAAAAECAGRQGRFPALYSAAYAQQDSLPVKSVVRFAEAAGISDMPAFERCLTDPTIDSVIRGDERLAMSLQGKGTPLIVINGVLFPSPPSIAELDSALATALQGKHR
jgi:protein-disulfide isomerase